MVEPGYQDRRGDKVPVWRESGIEVRVFSGRSGNIEGPAGVTKHVPVTMLDVRLDGVGDTSFTQELPAGDDEGFVYVLSGQGQFSQMAHQWVLVKSVTSLTLIWLMVLPSWT